VLAAAAAAVLGGAVVAAERLDALDRTVLVPAADASVVGYVTDAPRERAFGVRVVPVRLTAGEGRGELVQLRLAAWVRWPRDARIGDEVAAQGRLRALRPRETFERRRHVHAVLEADRVTATGRSRGSPIDAIRERAERSLSSGMRPEQAALARGMVLGQDHALPADLRDAFRASGLAHLVAASGSNVMLLVALVIALSVVAGVPLRRRLALALAAVVLYVPLAGAGPSIQRAGVMGAAGLIAALAGRPASRWYALLLAAAATLAHDPSAAEEPGWQLSFAAVIAILALYRPVRGWLVAHRVPGALADATALTTAATAGTAPLLSMHFGELSLVSLPANVLAAPAVAPVMWLGAGAAVLGGDGARVLDALCAYPLAYLAWLGRTAASLPHASVAAELPGPVAAAAAYALVGGLWLAPPRVRRAALGGCALLAAVALGLAPGPPGPPAGFAVSFLDVGQGDATLVQHGDHAVLVDTGPPGAPVLDRLRSAGVRRLDALVLTHPQADHDGNAERVLAALPTELLLDGSGRVRAPAA
jgi:competence protein ComEC